MLEPAKSFTDLLPRAIGMLAAGAIATLAVVSIVADQDNHNSELGGDAPLVVVTHPQQGQRRTVELPGSFEPYEQARLHAKLTGYVSMVKVDIGDRVKRGALVVQLDLPEMAPGLARAKADLLVAEAALRKTRAEVDLARITSDRLTELKTQEPLAVTQQDVDVAVAEKQAALAKADSGVAEVAVARAEVEHLEAMMSFLAIRAPFDGVVTRRFVHPGTLVVAGDDGGEPVLEVVRDDRLRLVLSVPEAIVPLTRNGLEAEISVDALPDRTFGGVISRCADSLSSDTRNMRAEIDLENDGGLVRPGMYATVRLVLDEGHDVLTVPASLVRRENGEAFVWTVRDGLVQKTAVEIARDNGDRAVIDNGLGPESLVVVSAPRDLSEGQSVRIRTEESPR